MCAICGIIDFRDAVVPREKVEAMSEVMRDRGPDAAGLQMLPHAGLGHRRLRVLDLTAAGDQPMSGPGQRAWVVFNGEIYNHRSLRAELAAEGHHFKTRSDTEVIVVGYQAWGTGIFARLEGMFAVGIWDAVERKLLLARDNFGKKPLYYRELPGQVQFASDVKALWLIADRQLTVDPQAVDCYLHHLGVPQQHTIFKEVAKVQPGHWMEFQNGQARSICYWKAQFLPKHQLDEQELIETMEGHLKAAVQRRMESDVPFGVFLSGGVDSSLVTAMMSLEAGRPCRTFSLGFGEEDYSELRYARRVVETYRTNHQEIILRPAILQDLATLVWAYGEPFADSSCIPTYYLSQAAKQYVTVALTGDGGDEIFGGYDIAKAAYFAAQYERWLPSGLRRKLDGWLLGGTRMVEQNRSLHRLKTLAVRASRDPHIRHQYSMAFNEAQRLELYQANFRHKVGQHHHYHIFEAFEEELLDLHLIDQYLLLTQVSRLPNDYLVKTDVASMANGLELRSPFLDNELVAFTARIDPLIKVKGGRQKYLLKKLAEKYLPKDVLYRKKKGFSMPLEHWLRKDFQPVLRRMLSDGWLVRNEWFRKEVITRYIDEHAGGDRSHTHRLWAVLWLELWCRMFLEGSLRPGDSLVG